MKLTKFYFKSTKDLQNFLFPFTEFFLLPELRNKECNLNDEPYQQNVEMRVNFIEFDNFFPT